MAGDRLDALLSQIYNEFPNFRIVRKDTSGFQRALHRTLAALTLGGMRRYLDSYQTTLGQTIYVTADWEERSREERFITLRHELVHMRQFRRYGRLGMALIYLLLPLPMGLSYFRARLEWEAYRETIRATAEVHGRERVTGDAFRSSILAQFTGPAYGWMWPFRRQLESWYDRAVAEID